MKKLEEMSMPEILSEINLCIGITSMGDIWKKESENMTVKKTKTNPEGKPAIDLLQDDNLLEELMVDTTKLIRFIIEHGNEIDKARYVMVNLQNYKRNIEKSTSEEVTKEFELLAAKARKLLKGVNKIYVEHLMDNTTGKIAGLKIISTIDEAENKPKQKKEKNIQRLKALKDDEDFANIAQAISTKDVEQVIAYNKGVGAELRFMIEYNSLIDAHNGDMDYVTELLRTKQFDAEVEKTLPFRFTEEMTTRLSEYIDEIDIDKMLLCSGIRFIEGMENDAIKPENAADVYEILQTIRKHIKKNINLILKITNGEKHGYGVKELEKEMKKFIKIGEDTVYITKQECKNIHEQLLEGNKNLNDLPPQMLEALQLNEREVAEILKKFPENYIWFLKQDKCPYPKTMILSAIKNARQCSPELLRELCERTDITSNEIRDLFDSEIISVNGLKITTNTHRAIITKEQIFDKYREYQESKEKTENLDEIESKKVQLERYALAYKNIEFTENTPEEKQKKSDEFMDELGDRVDTTDLIPLYGLDLLTLETVVDWGGESTIEQLVENESLKPADARKLRDEGLLDENVLENLFKNSSQMSYAYQVALVYAVFDGQTQEEKEIRDRLAQYYHIENAITHSSGNTTKPKKNREVDLLGEQNEPKEKIKMRDPGAKYNLLASFDKDVKIEEGIVDGHIIFHYPNIDGGTILIEKLHRITSNKQTRQIEIKPDNQSATYVMSEEEFIKMRPQLIDEGKVDRTKLTQKWWITRDPGHWIPHAGTSAWETALRERFNINGDNSRYSPKELSKIEGLIEKSIESKRGEER